MLLDGDGMIFKDEFLQKGEQGGQNAAKQLYIALEDYLNGNFPHLISPKIMTKLYVNVKGLSDTCVRAGIISDPSLIDNFVRGFNNSAPLFDLVDIGSRKDRVHDKIGGLMFARRIQPAHANLVFLVQKSSNSIYTIVTATKSSSDARRIVNTLESWRMRWPIGTS